MTNPGGNTGVFAYSPLLEIIFVERNGALHHRVP